ncbi:hypothetical protein [Marinicella sp. W31]|uniref:hypothetical protein n=1 Tax=Marinicella sp. W31 TaxID=3023713 RepID=UPI003756CB8B
MSKKAHQATEKNQEHTETPNRIEVIRDAIVIQIKLVVDGFRDLILLPCVLFAAAYGVLRHDKNPGRHLYRLMSYGRASEHWIGLFDDAKKDQNGEIEFKGLCLDELVSKAQKTLESKYLDEEKKQIFLNRFNAALDDLNGRLDPNKKTTKEESAESA